MADLNDPTQNVNIWDDAKTKSVTVTTNGARECLDVDANISFDSATGAINTVDYAHHEIHGGSFYTVADFSERSTNNVLDIRITTPDTTKWAHFRPSFDVFGEAEYIFTEVAVIDTVGTTKTPINRNRNSVNTAGVAVDVIENSNLSNANADTDITGGTTIFTGLTGTSSSKIGGASDENEYVLKQNTIYNFRFISGASSTIDYHLDWYEHTNP